MRIINRRTYIEKIVTRLNKGMMIVLVGQRRVGKSVVLRQLKDQIEQDSPESAIFYINKEWHDFSDIKTGQQLYEVALEKFGDNKSCYLLVDEIQDIENYDEALRSLYSEQRCQIVVTGSNAYLFSSEIATRFAGRYIEIPIYNLSYKEFLELYEFVDSEETLRKYLKVGGLPGLAHFDIDDESQVRDYLQGVYNTIMMRDVITRENLRNVNFIENLARFVADNIGKLISVSSIARFMKSQSVKVSEPVISSYIRHLCNALIINPVVRYDIRGKKLFEQIYKYYFSDHGLRNLLCDFNLRGSIEKIIENVIYNHLLIWGFKVDVGELRNGEIDFVARRGSQTIYIQATYLLASQETIEREFGNLKKIGDNYPKYVVSMDPIDGAFKEYPGIEHISLREFLTTKKVIGTL